MFNKTISKNFVFVISIFLVCFLLTACHLVSSGEKQVSQTDKKEYSDQFESPRVLGKIKSDEIKESSGLVASRCNPEVFWTHNDSGDKNFIYALDKTGKKMGTYRVTGAAHDDWEDIATFKNDTGECFLYIGDIGNNARTRSVLTIYKVPEPEVSAKDDSSGKKNPIATEKAEAIKFTYPDVRHDAESLLIHPQTEVIYVLSKRAGGAAGVYQLKDYQIGKTQALKKIGTISVPALPNGLLTGGEISPDGSRVILCDYYNGYELVLPKEAKNFDLIWKDEPSIVELGKREQGEAICYGTDGQAIYATSEKKNSPFIEVRRKN
jgi:hypothetical protein